MSYGNPTDAGPRRGRRLGIAPLLILVVLAFIVFSRGQTPPGDDPPSSTPNEPDVVMPGDGPASEVPSRSGESSQSTRGDWSIEEVETVEPVRSHASRGADENSVGQSTNQGDWSIEEVEATGNANSQRAKTPSTPKSTERGDWKLEEVE
ncbi:MAG: hypothetical protein KDA60_01680 [Planctomycetales bacterium]|nr:hypothetical protein [Planctomycetales bacterium]